MLLNNHITKYNSFILVLYRRYKNHVSVCPPTFWHIATPLIYIYIYINTVNGYHLFVYFPIRYLEFFLALYQHVDTSRIEDHRTIFLIHPIPLRPNLILYHPPPVMLGLEPLTYSTNYDIGQIPPASCIVCLCVITSPPPLYGPALGICHLISCKIQSSPPQSR